jgi:hypothetical protein
MSSLRRWLSTASRERLLALSLRLACRWLDICVYGGGGEEGGQQRGREGSVLLLAGRTCC